MLNKDCYITQNCNKYVNGNCPIDEDFCMRLYKIDYLLSNSLLTETQKQNVTLHYDSDGTDKKEFYKLKEDYLQRITKFASNGENLYIYSHNYGNGKTSWAIKLIKEYVFKVWPESQLGCRVMFISVPKFLLELKANISKKSEYIEFIQENLLLADIVVWDDIATKSASEFEHEHLLSLIDSRLYENKSNIFTSNINPNDLSDVLGGRLASRIINRSETIEFKGIDKRGVNK